MEHVIAYVDGYNLYHGLRDSKMRRFYWLNIQELMQQFTKPHQTLVTTKYFTTVVKTPADKRIRQSKFLDSLRTLRNFSIFYGHFLSDNIVCRNCGYAYTTHHEKMTDVNISVELMKDAFEDLFDVAFLLSADSDLVPSIRAVRGLFNHKRIVAIFPPGRFSTAIKHAANGVLHIDHVMLAKSVFPDEILKDGVVIRRPEKWR
jgi:uncharacterized LabA/DUF88 family protein